MRHWLGVALLALLVGCGAPADVQIEPGAPHPPVLDAPYLVREFAQASDAQSWINEHWPRYRLYAIRGNGANYRLTYVLCHVERSACDAPVIVQAY